MKVILNSVHKFKFSPENLDVIITSPAKLYNDITPDIIFMCQLTEEINHILSDEKDAFEIISVDGSIFLSLKAVKLAGEDQVAYYMSVNHMGGDMPIGRAHLSIFRRVLDELYWKYAN